MKRIITFYPSTYWKILQTIDAHFASMAKFAPYVSTASNVYFMRIFRKVPRGKNKIQPLMELQSTMLL